MSVHTLQLMIILMFLPLTGNNMNRTDKEKQYYYCEYCGKKFPDVRTLTSATCPRHPDGSNKGHHKLYEGCEKQEYTCKYCARSSLPSWS